MNIYNHKVFLATHIALCFLLFCVFTQYANSARSWLEIKPSYFLFSKSPMKNIYKKGAFEIQASISTPIIAYLNFYGSIGFRQAYGHALNSWERTRLIIVPFDVGLRPIVNFYERFNYFFTIGPRFFYAHQRNHSSYLDCTIQTGGVGLFANTGFNILWADHFLLGIFAEYSYEKRATSAKKTHVYSNGSIQMGGFACGVSLGYAF